MNEPHLTKTARKILAYVTQHIENQQESPTVAEIAQGCDMQSTGTVHRYLSQLIEAGALVRSGKGWRNLALPHDEVPEDDNPYAMPFLGKVAAGLPIEAISQHETIDFSEYLFGPKRFALYVDGESMIELGIMPGDTAILEHANTADNGDIVCALVDHEEATLKTFYRKGGGMVELHPANSEMQVQTYSGDRVQIQGILKASFRSYQAPRWLK
ncbi:MAG: repressor LexA [Gammaproteobacteria bacterium]|nr:transcriptional repressor LexA [Gammaproteobacteria bacterium]NNC97256.1 repressor LexA [Gammaproteobacteria bacterium]NNM14167.1 repressor LexA [Gammaproteobacteria bacterium]